MQERRRESPNKCRPIVSVAQSELQVNATCQQIAMSNVLITIGSGVEQADTPSAFSQQRSAQRL